jgi:hypothetical protein
VTTVTDPGDLESLRSTANQARNTIVERFLDAKSSPLGHADLVAWGQYLDLQQHRLSNQFGIYGTSAGIQVLALHDARLHQNLWKLALRILPVDRNDVDVADRHAHDVRNYFINKNDLDVPYKVSALVDAIQPEATRVPGSRYHAVELLLYLRLRGGGWPDFRAAGLEQYNAPKVHATACALLALARFPDVQATDDWREAVGWLARNLTPELNSIATLSICLLALAGPASTAPAGSESAQLYETCLRAVVEWSKRAWPNDVLRTLEATEYLVPGHHNRTPLADHEFTFLLYSPHCLATLALMRCGAELSADLRRHVTDVVRIVAETICQKRAFIAAGRTLVSSVEHLWIYRLLHEFQGWGERI